MSLSKSHATPTLMAPTTTAISEIEISRRSRVKSLRRSSAAPISRGTAGLSARFGWREKSAERGHERGARGPEFGLVEEGELPKEALALRGDVQEDLAPVVLTSPALDESPRGEAVREPDDAVVTQLDPLREDPDRGALASWKAFDGEQQLVLAGLDAGGPSRRLAERDEPADPISKLGEGFIVRSGRHIVTRYIMPARPAAVKAPALPLERRRRQDALPAVLPHFGGGLPGGVRWNVLE
jgi:hypothetical protein